MATRRGKSDSASVEKLRPGLEHLGDELVTRITQGVASESERRASLLHLMSCSTCRERLLAASGIASKAAFPPVQTVPPWAPSLRFYVTTGVEGPSRRRTSHVISDPARSETYTIRAPRPGQSLRVGVRCARPAFATFAGNRAPCGGWELLAPPVRLQPLVTATSTPIAGLRAGILVVVVVTERPSHDVVGEACAGQTDIDGWIPRVVTSLRSAGHEWVETPMARLDP